MHALLSIYLSPPHRVRLSVLKLLIKPAGSLTFIRVCAAGVRAPSAELRGVREMRMCVCLCVCLYSAPSALHVA